jgi:hypothetical protein
MTCALTIATICPRVEISVIPQLILRRQSHPPPISFDRIASSEHAGCQIEEGLQRINMADRTS